VTRLGIAIGCVLVFLSAAILYSQLPGSFTPGVFPANGKIPPTPYSHYSAAGPSSRARILVVHGLDANKSVMNMFCAALADAGFDVYSIDLPGHGDSAAAFEGTLARDAVASVLNRLGGDVIAIGHSMGSGLLLDIANDYNFKSMVLLSPPPTPVERLRAERVLVFTGQFDVPSIVSFVPQLKDAGTDDVQFRTVRGAGHSGALFRADIIKEIVVWLGGDGAHSFFTRRMLLVLAMLAATVVLGTVLVWGPPIATQRDGLATSLVWYTGAVLSGVLVAAVVVVLEPLRLFAFDYFFSVVLVAGGLLLLRRPRVRFVPANFAKAGAVAVYWIVAPGLFVLSNFTHVNLSDGRWWRMGLIAAACLPLFVWDEVFLRPMRPWWKAAAGIVLSRSLVMGLMVTGALTLNRSAGFVVLIIHLVMLFWIGLWFIAAGFRRHTQDPLATAVLISVIQAWFLAAALVTT
jgi:pimeloyl-ACP methyl ester carboxylesterase